MKRLMSLSLALSFGLLGLSACSHGASSESTTTAASEPVPSTTDTSVAPGSSPSAKEGWEDMKDGTKQAASGVGEAAKAGGNKVVEGTKEVGRDIKEGAKEVAHEVKSTACPVLGNKTTKKYYAKDSRNYKAQLSGKTAIASENRECFSSEANAREAGYKSAN